MAEAIVTIVVARLTDLLVEEPQLLHGVKDEIQEVVTKLRWMKTFLQDADSRISEPKVWTLVADIRDLAYDAENVVESFIVEASSTARSKREQEIKIKDIERKMSVISDRICGCGFKSTLVSSNSSYGTPGELKRFYSFTTVEPEIFVGFHGDVDRLVGHLVNESDDCYRLISICGMGGLGKTTLAQKIYNHPTIKTSFAGLAWVSISQKWQRKLVLQRILICLIHEKKKEILTWDDDKLVENLLQIQQTKKCLIVLDDIWTTDAWDSMKLAFTAETSVSKLMLTSRNVEVAVHVNRKGLMYQPECLNAEQSWELLKLKALPRGDHLDPRSVTVMEKLGREMVENCGGLPLAIVILGGILVTKPSVFEWEKVHADSLLSLKKGKGFGETPQKQLLDVLVWSYNDLPPQLKPCFLYLGKYSEDEQIEVETLYQLWIAEGMVLSTDKREGETMMQVAESYMGELFHRSMVQVTFEDDMESSLIMIKYFSLHDLMRDLSLSQAKAEDFFEVIDLRKENDLHLNSSEDFRSVDTRQLVVYYDRDDISQQNVSYFVKKSNQQQCRSMLLFTYVHQECMPRVPKVVRSHVANFRFLRVLSMENASVVGLFYPRCFLRALGSLVYLRYLSVRNSQLSIIPFMQDMVLLQTLKIDLLFIRSIPSWLSKNILGKLVRLQHLYLPINRTSKNLKLQFDGLSKLETLENFNTTWCEVKDLPKLVNLHKLTLEVSGSYDDVEESMKNLAAIALSSSSNLRYLGLTIRCDERLGEILRQLFWDYNFILQKLCIDGRLPELAQLFDNQRGDLETGSLIRITYLHLYSSNMEEDPMPVLEKIPTLRYLCLSTESFVGKKMVCSSMGFPKLTNLQLVNLPNLVKWSVEEGSMPVLTGITIFKCSMLEELPQGMIFLTSLQRLSLFLMPTDFTDKLVVDGKLGPDFYKIAHIPDFTIHIFN